MAEPAAVPAKKPRTYREIQDAKRQQAALAQAGQVQGRGLAPPAPPEAPKTLGQAVGLGAEMVASSVAPVVAGPLIRGAAGALGIATRSPLVEKGVELAGRTATAGLASLGVSEGLAQLGPQETPEEAAFRRTESFLGGAGGEALSGPVAKAANLALAPIKRRLLGTAESKLVAGAPEAQALVTRALTEAGVPAGATLTAGAMRRGWVSALEKIAEAGYGGMRFLQPVRDRAAGAGRRALQQFIPKLTDAMDLDEVGELIEKTVAGEAVVARTLTRAAYGNLDNAVARAGGQDSVYLHSVADSMVGELSEAVRAGDRKAAGIVRLLTFFSRRQKLPNGTVFDVPISFKQAEKVRSSLLSMARPTEGDLMPDVRRVASAAAKLVDEQIDAGMSRLGVSGEEILAARNIAREMSRTSHEVFENEALVAVLNKASGEQVAQGLFRAERPTQIRRMRELIFNKAYRAGLDRDPGELWGEIQSAFMKNKVHDAGGATGFGTLSGKKLRQALEHSEGTYRELFPDPVQRQNILASARAIELAQEPVGGRNFNIAVQFIQFGALTRAGEWAIGMEGPWSRSGFAPEIKSDLTVLIAPAMIGAVLSRRGVANALMNAARFQERNAGRAVGSLAAQAGWRSAQERLIRAVQESGVPFRVRDNRTGQQTTEAPAQPAKPKGTDILFKPQSKMRAPTP